MVTYKAYRITSDDTVPMGTPPTATPDQVFVWKVDIRMPGNEIDILYDKVAPDTLGTRTINEYLVGLVDGTIRPRWQNPTTHSAPSHSQRKLTPFSLHFNGYAYHVLYLEDRNWQFSVLHEPFEVEVGRDHLYLHALAAWSDADGSTAGPVPPVHAQSRVASFLANAAQDQIENGGITGEFWTRFNIYLDLRIRRGADTLLLPIAIDPDVGHPGGTAP